MKQVKVLGISGSPRKDGNTTALVRKALEGAASVHNVATELYQLAGKKVHHCIACFKCLEKGRCIIEDDLQEIVDKYMAADGIIWGAPVYFVHLPASMKAVIDRLGNSLATRYVVQGGDIPRLCKVGGAVTGGAHRNGGQDLVLSYLNDCNLILNGFSVSGDTVTGSYIGSAAYAGGKDPIGKENVLYDSEGLHTALTTGQRVAEATKIVQAGITALGEELPSEYRYTWEEHSSAN